MSVNAPIFTSDGVTDRGLLLTMYTGTVQSRFYNDNGFYDRSGLIMDYRNVGPGAAFQYIQDADLPSAEYFTPGDEMIGQPFAFDQTTIAPDDPIVSHGFHRFDLLQRAHWPALERIANQRARKIVEDINRKAALTFLIAARQSAKTRTVDGQVLSVHTGGKVTTRGTGLTLITAYPRSATGAQNVRADLNNQAYLYDVDNYPQEGRFAFVDPYIIEVLQYDALNTVQSNIFNNALSRLPGDLARRVVTMVSGFMIIPTNTMPSTNNVDARHSKYNVDARDTTASGTVGRPAMITCAGGIEGKAAVGYVESGGIMSVAKYVEEKMATFTFAGVIAGLDDIWPPSAGEVRVT